MNCEMQSMGGGPHEIAKGRGRRILRVESADMAKVRPSQTKNWREAAEPAPMMTSPWVFGEAPKTGMRSSGGLGKALHLERAVRFGTLGTAWDRLGPDKFFSLREKMTPKSQFQGSKSKVRSRGRQFLRVSEERRRASALQDAGAMHPVPFSPTQVVDISSRMAKMRVVSPLISRRLGRKRLVFGAFLTRRGVDFSPVTEILPDFFAITNRQSPIANSQPMSETTLDCGGAGRYSG
jgi:hypothetical protein